MKKLIYSISLFFLVAGVFAQSNLLVLESAENIKLLNTHPIGLELVSHLNIGNRTDYEVIVEKGILSLFSDEFLPPPMFSGNLHDSYTDTYLKEYGNNIAFLLDALVPIGTEPGHPLFRYPGPMEVYILKGQVVGRDELAEILHYDEYFVHKQKLKEADGIGFLGGLSLFSGGVAVSMGAFMELINLGAAVVNSDYKKDSAGYFIAGGVLSAIGIGLYVYSAGITPDEPLWDHELVRKEIIKYNNQLLSAAE